MAEVASTVEIKPLSSRDDWHMFWRLQKVIYKDDPHWIPPLRQTYKDKWSPKNPWFEHGKAQAWLALDQGQAVGAISAQFDPRTPTNEGGLVGHFGQFECINDPTIAECLLEVAAKWLDASGCTWMQGPFDLHINDTCGLLVDGFDSPPVMMMPHQPGYYRELLNALGFDLAIRLYAYRVAPNFEAPRAMQRLQKSHGATLSVRPLNLKRYDKEMELLCSLFNDAWQNNWGFVPFSASEFRQVGQELRAIIVPEFTCVAELDGEPVGFLIALPNLNELIRSFDGRLLPFNWLKLLWHLKRHHNHTARVPLMGVASRHHQTPLGALIAFNMMDRVRWPLYECGINEVEMSWILETNQGMNSLIEALGGERYKTYEILERRIGPSR